MREEELHRRFTDGLRAFTARRVPDAFVAEDVVQETLCQVITALRAGRVRDLDALPGFVFRTAHHLCAARARLAARERRLLANAGGVEAQDAPDPLEALLAGERAAAVHDALQRLPEPDRVLLQRFFYDEVEARQVARELGVAPGTVRVRKYRALRRLGEVLEEAELPPRRERGTPTVARGLPPRTETAKWGASPRQAESPAAHRRVA